MAAVSTSTYLITMDSCSTLEQSLVSSASTEYIPAFLALEQIFLITLLAIKRSNVFCVSGEVYVAFLGPLVNCC